MSSPSGRLYLLIIVGLILPTRGQRSEEATSISPAESTTENIRTLISTSDTAQPELHSTPQASTPQARVEATATQPEMETQTQQGKGEVVLLTTDPGTVESSREVTTPSKQFPDKDITTDCARMPTGSSEDNPFSYDNTTLRKRGLLVAAVLFITGIVILTSGKCRQLPRLCRNQNRTYRAVTKAQPETEDTDGARAGADGPSPQPCPP
ncbi:PREDICTED: FXYD domain-containing ion transport regulator 5 [Miniopterus natalensis]|uniref:FXYD domain-containing ion transport regulator 5 n=1 Tax=Miniopterus natalensis TaxID=291302 RepID=UPI0007A71985|nr:PREDICTED: FXYD domain-containing ion transport regulator 5 [Miniopterus natalensis]